MSIIIVNWHSAGYLRRCLGSVIEHTMTRAEIIVIDAASYDGCDTMIRDEFPKVRFIQCATNLGFAGCNNLAFDASSGRSVLFLNPDTELLNPAVDVLVSELERLPAAGVLGGRLLNSDGTVQMSSVLSFPTLANQFLGADAIRRRWPRSELWGNKILLDANSGPCEVQAVSGACLLVSRQVFETLGGFSEDYFMYAEDLDLAYKARRAGLRNYHVPGAVVLHRGGSSSERAGSAFSAVMLREANLRFLRTTRGVLYGGAYRLTMLAAAFGRLALLAPVVATSRGEARRNSARRSVDKWRAVAQWALGRDQLVRRYYDGPNGPPGRGRDDGAKRDACMAEGRGSGPGIPTCFE